MKTSGTRDETKTDWKTDSLNLDFMTSQVEVDPWAGHTVGAYMNI